MALASGPTPTQQQLLALIRAFLIGVLPSGAEVVLGQANRVPEPGGPSFVTLVFRRMKRVFTTGETWSASVSPPSTTTTHVQEVEADVQIQVFGSDATDWVNIITTTLRSPYACDFFNQPVTGIAPLYCDEGQQVPFISGESQYEDRYILDAFFSMVITLSTAQQFAASLTLDLVEVDARFPPA